MECKKLLMGSIILLVSIMMIPQAEASIFGSAPCENFDWWDVTSYGGLLPNCCDHDCELGDQICVGSYQVDCGDYDTFSDWDACWEYPEWGTEATYGDFCDYGCTQIGNQDEGKTVCYNTNPCIEAGGDLCFQGEYRCSQQMVEGKLDWVSFSCDRDDNGCWRWLGLAGDYDVCPNGCKSDGTCATPDQDVCKSECFAETQEKCDENGNILRCRFDNNDCGYWDLNDAYPCPSGSCDPVTDSCFDEFGNPLAEFGCKSLTRRCGWNDAIRNNLYICEPGDPINQWSLINECDYGCYNGLCSSEPIDGEVDQVCAEGEKRCHEGLEMECAYDTNAGINLWTIARDCYSGKCVNGECVQSISGGNVFRLNSTGYNNARGITIGNENEIYLAVDWNTNNTIIRYDSALETYDIIYTFDDATYNDTNPCTGFECLGDIAYREDTDTITWIDYYWGSATQIYSEVTEIDKTGNVIRSDFTGSDIELDEHVVPTIEAINIRVNSETVEAIAALETKWDDEDDDIDSEAHGIVFEFWKDGTSLKRTNDANHQCTQENTSTCTQIYESPDFDGLNDYVMYPLLAYSSENDRLYVLYSGIESGTRIEPEICEYSLQSECSYPAQTCDIESFLFGCFNIDPPMNEYLGFDYKNGKFYLLDSHYSTLGSQPDVFMKIIDSPYTCKTECNPEAQQCTKDGLGYVDCIEVSPGCWKYFSPGFSTGWYDSSQYQVNLCNSDEFCEEFWANHKIKKARCTPYSLVNTSCVTGELSCSSDKNWVACVERVVNARGDVKLAWNTISDPIGVQGTDWGICNFPSICSNGQCVYEDHCEIGESQCFTHPTTSVQYKEECTNYTVNNNTINIWDSINREPCEFGCVPINITNEMRIVDCLSMDTFTAGTQSSFAEIENWANEDIAGTNPLVRYVIGAGIVILIIIGSMMINREITAQLLNFIGISSAMIVTIMGLLPFELLYAILVYLGLTIFQHIRGGGGE